MSVSQMFPMPEKTVPSCKYSMLIGPQNSCKTSLLFQCLKTSAAERRKTVLFLAPEKVMELPQNVHKMHNFSRLTAHTLLNVYLMTADDLLEFLAKLHVYDIKPCVIAVDDFNVFMQRRKKDDISYFEYAGKIMSMLIETASNCGDCSVSVSADIDEEDEHERKVVAKIADYYFDQVWVIDKMPSLGARAAFVMKCEKVCRSIHYYVEEKQIFLDEVKEEVQKYTIVEKN